MKLLLKLLIPLVKNRISVLSVCQSPINQRVTSFQTKFLSTDTETRTSQAELRPEGNPQKKEKPKWGTNKAHRDIKLKLVQMMADPKIEAELAPLRESVKEQVIF